MLASVSSRSIASISFRVRVFPRTGCSSSSAFSCTSAVVSGFSERPLKVVARFSSLRPSRVVTSTIDWPRGCARVSATVDVSHVGIRQCQRAYEKLHPGHDVCQLKWNSPALRERIADVQAACASANPVTVKLVNDVARVGKPMHFHLHDGHPASTFNPFGVSDHLSFFAQIPIPFEHDGARHLPLIHGQLGLRRILAAARAFQAQRQLGSGTNPGAAGNGCGCAKRGAAGMMPRAARFS